MDPKALRLTDGFGLALAPLDVCRSQLDGWTIGSRSIVSVLSKTRDFNEAATFLSQLTHPATRHVMIPLGEATLFTNNARSGPSFADHTVHVSTRLHTRAARIVDMPARFWSDGTHRERQCYEARILEVYDDGACIRSIVCVDDGGRWVFESSGDPLPIEEGFDYQARRKKDRLTSGNLRALVAAYGLPYPDLDAFLRAGEYVLLHERLLNAEWERQVESLACTREQRDDPAFGYYQRGLTWVEHIDTHAESVIADFERAVRLNPAYEPLVEKHLKRARRIVCRGQ